MTLTPECRTHETRVAAAFKALEERPPAAEVGRLLAVLDEAL